LSPRRLAPGFFSFFLLAWCGSPGKEEKEENAIAR